MADLHALRQLALETLAANRREGTSDWEGRPFNYVCPASDEYPFQWLWDSAFHAIALLHVDPELAKQEIRCLLQAWQPDGFMPHMVLWNPQGEPRPELTYPVARAGDYVTASTQPAVVARALERIYERTGDEGFIRECLPQTALFFDWLWTNRDPDHDSLLSIIQPDESGLDTSPRFDLALGLNGRATIILPEWRAATVRLFERYAPFRGDQHRLLQEDAFQVEDVLVNSIFADGLRSLARLARQIGASGVDAFELDRRAGLVTHALI
ncbi:MAG: hypothetical protein JOZ39_12330, partial [Chloroflexi bacterium]|nr:hypothetical protein [Chloroflexota bacterium]